MKTQEQVLRDLLREIIGIVLELDEGSDIRSEGDWWDWWRRASEAVKE